ncbi:unnamed protein product [Toxocara canis]|uniref:Uncharacterized protein n=2 Tax=Toxocara canis TaxID=6265 RepID=A0A183VEJ6_TOXCA|nr:unnamed protein product [Toxocara canis]
MLTIIVCLMMLIVIILLNICILKYPGSCYRNARDNSQIELSDSVQRIYSTQPIIRNEKMKRYSRDRASHSHDYCTSDLPFLQHNFSRKCSVGSTDSGIADKEQEDNERNTRLLHERPDDTNNSHPPSSRFDNHFQSSVIRTSASTSSNVSSNYFAANIPLKYLPSGLHE